MNNFKKRNTTFIDLINPKSLLVERFSTVTDQEYLKYGPFQALKNKEYLFFFKHLTLTVFSFGTFWIRYSKTRNINKIEALLSIGWDPSEERDKQIIELIGLKGSGKVNSTYLPISRLGGGDHLVTK